MNYPKQSDGRGSAVPIDRIRRRGPSTPIVFCIFRPLPHGQVVAERYADQRPACDRILQHCSNYTEKTANQMNGKNMLLVIDTIAHVVCIFLRTFLYISCLRLKRNTYHTTEVLNVIWKYMHRKRAYIFCIYIIA